MSMLAALQNRQRQGCPIRVAVVGTGFFGGGLVRQLARLPGLRPAVVANRTLDRGVAALHAAGIEPSALRVCHDLQSAQSALDEGLYVATDSLLVPTALDGVEVVMEATGDVLVGAQVAVAAIRHRKHMVAANPETQATIGPILKQMADEAGVVYSDVDGDEPGILKNLYDYCTTLGLTPVVAGNCKGVLKRYATPETQAAFAQAHGLRPWIASAAADGTKLNLEMTTVANATGLPPAIRGMAGPRTTLETVVDDFERLGLLSRGPIVEYTLGIPNGVFVICRSDDRHVRRELAYLKMGDGPYYLLHRPYVMVHYEAPLSAAEAVLFGTATITPCGAPIAEAVAYAKRDLLAGHRLDGIGGFDCYGLIARADEARRDELVPIGLASYVRLTHDVAKDEPIRWETAVVDEENLVTSLRKQQETLFATPARVGLA